MLNHISRALLAAVVLLGACQSEVIDNSMMVDVDGPVTWSEDIQPLFSTSCGGAGCHIGERTSGVELTTHSRATSSIGLQYDGPIIVAGDPAGSPILNKLQRRPRFGQRMPLVGEALSNTEIEKIRIWIEEGAQDN